MNKGFTLVELIAVIVILALLMIITTPAYDSISKNIKTRNYESKKSTIKSQTLAYVERYMKNEVYSFNDSNNDGKNDYTLYLKINNLNEISSTGIEYQTNISKALCFTPDYLIRNGIISSDDDKDEFIKNDKEDIIYKGNSQEYIKIYYNTNNLKLNSIIVDEKNIIYYLKGTEEKELKIDFDDIICSKIDNVNV